MEYRNTIHVPRLGETGISARCYLCPQSHILSGHSSNLEDRAIWNTSIASSSSSCYNGPYTVGSYYGTQSYSFGMPSGSCLHTSAAVSNLVTPNLQESSISFSTSDTHQAEYGNNFTTNNQRGLYKRRRLVNPVCELDNLLRFHTRGNSLDLPIYDGAHHRGGSTSTFGYFSSGGRDEAGLPYGRRRNVQRRVGTGFNHDENSSGISMHRSSSAGHYLGELHGQSSSVRRATTMEGPMLAHGLYQRMFYPVNISSEAHHLPLIPPNSGSSSARTNYHNCIFSRNSVMHLQNPHVAPIEFTRSGHRELFQWNSAAQRSSSSDQLGERSRSSTNTMSYGSQSVAEPDVSMPRFPRPLSLLPERRRGRSWRNISRRSFRRSQTNSEATARAALIPESATLRTNIYHHSEFPIGNQGDMHLDIDDMAHLNQELLALGEYIGDVCTGLSQKTISKRLKKKILIISGEDKERVDSQTSLCTICQEEYKNKDELTTLNYGHDYHYNCIKHWLTLKNLCPICKATAIGS